MGGWGEEFGGEVEVGGTNPATVLILPEAVGLIARALDRGHGLALHITIFLHIKYKPFRNMMESMTGPNCQCCWNPFQDNPVATFLQQRADIWELPPPHVCHHNGPGDSR